MFTFYIDDDRYADPVSRSVTIPNGVAVRKHARTMLDTNQHYREIEVCVAATSLFRVGRGAEAGPRAA